MRCNHFVYNTYGEQNGVVHIFLRSAPATLQENEEKTDKYGLFKKITFLLKKIRSFTPFKPVFSADVSAELDKRVDEQWRNTS